MQAEDEIHRDGRAGGRVAARRGRRRGARSHDRRLRRRLPGQRAQRAVPGLRRRRPAVKVKDDVYNGEMAKVYSMVKAGDVTYDVIMVEAPELVRGCEDGIFEKIDWSVVKKDKFIPGGTSTCGAGAVLWGVTLFYDPTKIKDGPDTYAKLWDVKTYPGKRSLRFDAQDDAGDRAARRRRAAGRRLQGARHARGPEARVRQARPDQAAPHVVEVRHAAGAAHRAAATSRTRSASPAASCAPTTSGAKYPLLWKTLLYSVDSGRWSRARRMRRKA